MCVNGASILECGGAVTVADTSFGHGRGTCTCACGRVRARVYTRIYIYIYIYTCRPGAKASRRPSSCTSSSESLTW